MSNDHGILLESGTGEVEVLEFVIGREHYAINVMKIKEILNLNNITKVPNTPPAVAGMTSIRQDVITVIDMKYVLEGTHRQPGEKQMILLCEFNNLKVAFSIDEVLGIHRVGWDKLQKPDILTESTLVIGNIKLDNKILMLLDFEKIVTDISPTTGISDEKIKNIEEIDRSNISVVLADDSPLIRQLLKDVLTKSGFTKLKFFDDGQAAYDYLDKLGNERKEAFKEDVDILITDIEMPRLDGHTLTRKIKEHEYLKELPVIIFSSLITGDLLHKGESVGADAQMSKPEVGKLVGLMDNLIKNK